jgi:hypothetical protein
MLLQNLQGVPVHQAEGMSGEGKQRKGMAGLEEFPQPVQKEEIEILTIIYHEKLFRSLTVHA